jgi:hypothetical protein
VLLAGLLLSTGEALSAQSTGNALPEAAQAASPAKAPGDTSSKPQSTPEPGAKFEDLVRLVQKEGRSATIGDNIAEDLGLARFSEYRATVQAHALDDADSQRVIYAIDDNRSVLFVIKTGDIPVVYVAERAGALREAGRILTGRLGSQSFQRMSADEARTGFNAEKEFWLKTYMGAHSEAVRQQAGPSLAKVKSGAAMAPTMNPPSEAGSAVKAASRVTATAETKSVGGKHSGTEFTVSSTPVGAEIEIDRKVAGNTPMTVPLSHGEHLVTLRKDGYRIWRRRIKIEGSPLELNAELLPEKEKVHWF